MCAFRFIFVVAFSCLVYAAPALACDPNESCHRCLVSAFNHCIQSGNDPVCEARKKACQIAPPIVDTPGSPFGPGSPAGQGGILTPNEISNCVNNIQACPPIILGRLGYQVLAPITNQYIAYLSSQAIGRYRKFPLDLISQVQQYYSTDLTSLVFATNINTIHGSNITIGNTIFFTKDIDFGNDDDLRLVFHEMEHAVQYANRGGGSPAAGVPSFLAEYIPKAAGQVIQKRSFSVHDFIDLERAAISKSQLVSGAVLGMKMRFQNRCSHAVHMAVSYLDFSGQWHTVGYWDVNTGGDTYLNDNSGRPIRTHNAIIYFEAKKTDGSNISWQGETPLVVEGESSPTPFIMKNHAGQTSGDLIESYSCDGQ